MVLPYVHIAVTIVVLNAAASFSAPIIRRDEQPLPTILRQGDDSPDGSKRSSTGYFSVSGSDYGSPTSSLSRTSSSSSVSPSPHLQSSLHDEASWEATMRRIMADNRSGPSSPIRTPKVHFANELTTFSSPPKSPKMPSVSSPPQRPKTPTPPNSPKTPSMSLWQRVKKHSDHIAVGVGLASVAGLVALGATSRRDIDEREDLLYGRALMFSLDKLD